MKADKFKALVDLLDDPDQAVYQLVEQEFLQEDAHIIVQLERIWEISLDELLQSRIEKLIQQIQFKETSARIRDWSNQKHVDLFEGFFLISQYQYPELRLRTIRNKISKISQDAWFEITNNLTSIEKITILNHVFYEKHNFSINLSNLHLPQNCYLNHILSTKKGNPVSIAVLYMLIARDLQLPVQLIDFPRNPLLAYVDPEIAPRENGKKQSSVLFYINPSNRGAIIGRKEIDFFLKRNDQVKEDLFEQFCEDRAIIRKLITTLIDAYHAIGHQEKVDDLTAIARLL